MHIFSVIVWLVLLAMTIFHILVTIAEYQCTGKLSLAVIKSTFMCVGMVGFTIYSCPF